MEESWKPKFGIVCKTYRDGQAEQHDKLMIKYLESIGGKNTNNMYGSCDKHIYFINKYGIITQKSEKGFIESFPDVIIYDYIPKSRTNRRNRRKT